MLDHCFRCVAKSRLSISFRVCCVVLPVLQQCWMVTAAVWAGVAMVKVKSHRGVFLNKLANQDAGEAAASGFNYSLDIPLLFDSLPNKPTFTFSWWASPDDKEHTTTTDWKMAHCTPPLQIGSSTEHAPTHTTTTYWKMAHPQLSTCQPLSSQLLSPR
jgi:hypothetical protein